LWNTIVSALTHQLKKLDEGAHVEGERADYLEEPFGKKKISRITRAELAAVHSTITKSGHPTVATASRT